MPSHLICPHCKAELVLQERTYTCHNNHCFDLSKEGYLNLLRVNQKKSKSPGDNELMITARRIFLEQGFYAPLILGINQIIEENLGLKNKAFTALDSGCGEGYYSEKALRAQNLKCTILGTDISKIAVKNAAKKYKNNFYFVSSVYHLPIAEKSIDLVLSVFSPNHAKEFNRILNTNGFLIIVSPAENHMKQLAELIYNDFRPHEHKILAEMETVFDLHLAERISFDITIKSSETLQALHKMTPYYYNTSIEAQKKVANCNNIKINCDFHISVFKPNQIEK